MLSRDQILAAPDLPTNELAVPEWGDKVRLRVLTGAERDQLEAEFAASKGRGLPNLRARFAALVLCDEKGVRIFSDAEAIKLGGKSSLALDRIFEAGMKLNRIGPEEVKSLAGESAGDPSAASGTGSPSPSA